MYGKKPICNVCIKQIRPADKPLDTGCRDDDAQFESDTCSHFKSVSHHQLALRVAEIDRLLNIAWDVCMIILDKSGALPEIPE